MASAADYLSLAAESLLKVDELEAKQDRDGAFKAIGECLCYVLVAIAVELGVPLPATNGQDTGQVPGQGTLPR